jgi:hypothetical protein
MGERKIVEKAFLLFFSTFVSLLVSVAATGRNGRVVEHHPKFHALSLSSTAGTGHKKKQNTQLLLISS